MDIENKPETNKDFGDEILYALYQHRYLTDSQLTRLIFENKNFMSSPGKYTKSFLTALKDQGYIDDSTSCKINNKTEILYRLTPYGVRFVIKHFNLPCNIYDDDYKKLLSKQSVTYKDIQLPKKDLEHQYHLNEFAIDTLVYFKEEEKKIGYVFFNSIHILNRSSIKTDGLIYLPKWKIFLEQDVGTETEFVIQSKLKKYKEILKDRTEIDGNNVAIFFICKENEFSKDRISTIKKIIERNFSDEIKTGIDVCVDTRENLIKVLKGIEFLYDNKKNELKNLLRGNKDIEVKEKEEMEKDGARFDYDFHIKSKEGDRFCVLLSFCSSIKISFKIMSHNIQYKDPLIVVGESDSQITRNCIDFNLDNIENVYYTTINRIKKDEIREAIYKIFHNKKPQKTVFYSYNGEYKEDFVQKKVFEKPQEEIPVTEKIIGLLYWYRVLTIGQLNKLIYTNKKTLPKTKRYLGNCLRKLKKDNLVKEYEKSVGNDGVQTFYMLTTSAMTDIKRILQLSENIYKWMHHARGAIAKEKELELKDELYSHQYYLNEFAVEVEKLFSNERVGNEYEYLDELHVPDMSYVNPDGIIYMPGNIVFIEQDMGTEPISVIDDKWTKYRKHLESHIKAGYKYSIYFICKNGQKEGQRIENVKNSAEKMLGDMLGEAINLHVDTKENMFKVFEQDFSEHKLMLGGKLLAESIV